MKGKLYLNNLEIDTFALLGGHYTEQSPHSICYTTIAANDTPHIFWGNT
jgi:hypothetical protein